MLVKVVTGVYYESKVLSIILTHWGRVMHISICNLSLGSDNGLAPHQRQALSKLVLSIGPWGTHFSEIFIEIATFSFKKMYLKTLSGKWQPFVSASICQPYLLHCCIQYYRKVSNIRGTLIGNKIVDHSDVVGASPVGAAPTTSSFST